MKFAFVNNVRTEAAPRLRGICCICNKPTTSRCGSRRVWHWSHLPHKHCDPWWENETPWHRKWKGYFPKHNQEVVHFDNDTGEKHVADVKTNNGLVIELQNSPINPTELHSRENFYGNMIWIVNGGPFMDNFFILDCLPDPDAEFARDIVFCRSKTGWHSGFWRWSENPGHIPGSDDLVLLHGLDEIKDEIEQHYAGHHLFHWKYPRSVWFESERPVFFDYGSNIFVLWLGVYKKYGANPLWCVQYVSKQSIIENNGGLYA